MVTEDFRQFFRNIAGQLAELRKVTLHGITDPEPWGPPGRKSTGAKEFPDKSLVKYEVEKLRAHLWSTSSMASLFHLGRTAGDRNAEGKLSAIRTT